MVAFRNQRGVSSVLPIVGGKGAAVTLPSEGMGSVTRFLLSGNIRRREGIIIYRELDCPSRGVIRTALGSVTRDRFACVYVVMVC